MFSKIIRMCRDYKEFYGHRHIFQDNLRNFKIIFGVIDFNLYIFIYNCVYIHMHHIIAVYAINRFVLDFVYSL